MLPALAVGAVLVASMFVTGRLPGTSLTSIVSCGYGYGSPPVVTGVAPSFGPNTGGTNVTITGVGLCNATAVRFGATAATSFVVISNTQINAVSPAHANGVVDVTVTGPGGTSATTPADHFQYLPPQAGKFKNHPPLRLMDTRSTSPFGPGTTRNLTIGGANGVPANATAAVLNVTVVGGTASCWLTIWPAGSSMPVVSNLNWVAGLTIANLVQVGLGSGGQISINNACGSVQVIVDLEGWFEPPTAGTDGEFKPLAPSRVTDTRSGSGQANSGAHLGPGATLNILVSPADGVPGVGVEAVVANVTVTNNSASSWLTCWPTGQSMPVASNLNWTAHKTVGNRVTIMVGTAGMISCNNAAGTTDLIVDVNGWYTDGTGPTGAFFNAFAPNRITDTRSTSKVGPGATLVVTVAGVGGVPAMGSTPAPVAVVLNVTVTNGTAFSWVTVYPDGTALPLASDINFVAGQTVPNLVIVKLGANGKIDITNAGGSTDVIVDVSGWYG